MNVMARSEPSILFSQSFIHSQLDEYVDEILFAEPVVITACEFLEQNASPSTTGLSIVGATSPPSFALEVFVHCKGESRFRRLCQPFLYSHSSSNILELEMQGVVTSHLVLRGMYRSLTLIVYGNIAQDHEQFDMVLDLDNSFANVVRSPSEGILEDLPPALSSTKLSLEESLCSLRKLSFMAPEVDLAPEIKHFLLLIFKICQSSNDDGMIQKLAGVVVSFVSSYIKCDNGLAIEKKFSSVDKKSDPQQTSPLLADASNILLQIYKTLHSVGNELPDGRTILGPEADFTSLKDLVEMLYQSFPILRNQTIAEISMNFQNKNMILALYLAMLFCSSKESCAHFVITGGLERIVCLFSIEKSVPIILLLLGVTEVATRHGIGCEGFLGWWPRVDETIPAKKSDGYCYLLKLLFAKQRHDVASITTHVLKRLRLYEIVSRYEAVIFSLLATVKEDQSKTTDSFDSLVSANSMLRKILKILTSDPVEDPSPVAFAKRLCVPTHLEAVLSFRATINHINISKFTFTKCDMDIHLLSLLEERGFFPLSAALLSSPKLRLESGKTMETFLEVATSIQRILLMLLFHRSGLIYLAQSEATAVLVRSLQDVEDIERIQCMTLRQAAVLLSKGFFCRPSEVGMILELHLRVVTAIDMLLSAPLSDELLWVLWEICSISRSDSGRQAVLALSNFPEAVAFLVEILLSCKGSEPIDNGVSLSNPAVFHSAAEILEVLVTDATALSLSSWIEHALELHKALHELSTGSNRKDAPARLLEWIDAGAVYQKNGATGLLRYAAILASGGDAHLSSTTVLVTDSIDIENVGDSSNYPDAQVVENLLGKLVSDKYYDGTTLHSSSIVKLTVTFRVLAFISENSTAVASLYDEGAVTLIVAVLFNCKFMLERLSNTYDYLVDEGTECTTADLLLERSHEQSIVDLLIPSLVLLINILQKIQETKEQYRNRKLLDALLLLHREVSPKLAACSADFSIPYPSSAVGFATICRLLASALACWPIFGWTPALFHRLFENVQVTSVLALGPKDACSMLYLLGDLLPEEDIWLWRSELPPLSALRTLSVGTILGPQAEEVINWYLKPEYLMVLLVRLTPQLERIAQIVLHFASTALVVLQNMLRVSIIRIACQSSDCAVVLLRPIISWMGNHVGEQFLCEEDIFKMQKLLILITSLLDHPVGKPLLLKAGGLGILEKVLKRCSSLYFSDDKIIQESKFSTKGVSPNCWILPALKSLSLMFDFQSALSACHMHDKYSDFSLSAEEISMVAHDLLKLCQVLPVGIELVACMVTFKQMASFTQGRSAIGSILSEFFASFNEQEYSDNDPCENGADGNYWCGFPFLSCCKKLLWSLDSEKTVSTFAVKTVVAMASCAMCLSMEGENPEGVEMFKSLFGISSCLNDSVSSSSEKIKAVCDLLEKLQRRIVEDECSISLHGEATVCLVKESVKSMLQLCNMPVGSNVKLESIGISEDSYSLSYVAHSMNITSHLLSSVDTSSMDDGCSVSLLDVWKSNRQVCSDLISDGFMEKFVWECADCLPDRQQASALPMKRKISTAEGLNKRARDISAPESIIGGSTPYRGVNASGPSSAPNRRDTFRQRKPNTSRPPSMHVDDYVARERNIDGPSGGLNVAGSSHRGSTTGRPPSIHVDEFMARQRERQSQPSLTTLASDVQVRASSLEKEDSGNKLEKSHKLKADPDDDLQGIDIIFDEETGLDDKLPFPHPDDNIQVSPSKVGVSSPHSVVADTEGDSNETARFSHLGMPSASRDKDGGFSSNTPTRRSASRTELPATQESSVSPRKPFPFRNIDRPGFYEPSDESKYGSPVASIKGMDIPPANMAPAFPLNLPIISSAPLSIQSQSLLSYHQRGSPQKVSDNPFSGTFQAYPELKLPIEQPPLPPMPPPSRPIVPAQVMEQAQHHHLSFVSPRDGQPPLPSGFPPQVESNNTSDSGLPNLPSMNNTSSLGVIQPILDSRFSWNALSSTESLSSNTSLRPIPPLPPLPPPFSSAVGLSSIANSSVQTINQNAATVTHPPPSSSLGDSQVRFFSSAVGSMASYPVPPYAQSLLIARPSVSGTIFSSPALQQGQNLLGLSQPIPNSQVAAIQSMLPRLPPPPPPQLPRPHLLEHSMPPIPDTLLQARQPTQVPQIQFYYQAQQQEPLVQPVQSLLEQPPPANLQADNNTQQQREAGMTLEQYISSPEAIQSLLGDRDRLRQLLEQHPRIMQMLQERLGNSGSS